LIQPEWPSSLDPAVVAGRRERLLQQSRLAATELAAAAASTAAAVQTVAELLAAAPRLVVVKQAGSKGQVLKSALPGLGASAWFVLNLTVLALNPAATADAVRGESAACEGLSHVAVAPVPPLCGNRYVFHRLRVGAGD
jgi:hypothetical protein